jgi:hypothetical protein
VQPDLQATGTSIEPSAGVIRRMPREYAIRQTMEPVNTIFSVFTVRLRTHLINTAKMPRIAGKASMSASWTRHMNNSSVHCHGRQFSGGFCVLESVSAVLAGVSAR